MQPSRRPEDITSSQASWASSTDEPLVRPSTLGTSNRRTGAQTNELVRRWTAIVNAPDLREPIMTPEVHDSPPHSLLFSIMLTALVAGVLNGGYQGTYSSLLSYAGQLFPDDP